LCSMLDESLRTFGYHLKPVRLMKLLRDIPRFLFVPEQRDPDV
jgi:protein-L-isoaspartate O-methyltransferase